MDWKSIILLPTFCFCLSVAPIYAKGFSKLKKEGTKPVVKNQTPHFPIFLKVPNGWERIDDPTQLPAKVKVLYVGKGKGKFTPSINLACEETTMNLEEYVEFARNYHEAQAQTTCSKLGKIETKNGNATLVQIDRQTGWGNIRFLQASIVLNGTAYVITATATHEESVSLYPLFYQAIQSFDTNIRNAIAY